jgi:hypothetical protein
MMNKAQADVAYGFTTIARADPAYYAWWLMNHALGQYSMSGRLGDSIRERQGMAYYVFSSLDANVAEGPLQVRAGVGPANVDRAIASIERRSPGSRGTASRRRAQRLRQYLIYSMPRALGNSIAIFLQNAGSSASGSTTTAAFGLTPGCLIDDGLPRVTQPGSAHATIVVAGPYEDRVKKLDTEDTER